MPSLSKTVALVSMPFHVSALPSISLGLLKSELTRSGIAAQVYNFNLEFLPYLSSDLTSAINTYDEICYFWDYLPGEWLFSPYPSPDLDRAYFDALVQQSIIPPDIIQQLHRLRPLAEKFATMCALHLLAKGHDVIGFTSSFMQTQPSIAVATAVKRVDPDVRIVFGGSNAFGEMGQALLEQWPVIDVVAHGESDNLIEPLVRALRGEPGFELRNLQGISYRDNQGIVNHSANDDVPDMDSLPTPEYSEYFRTVRQLSTRSGQEVQLPHYIPIETSRGCWWGEKSHCTFCGLNADRMRFRSKSPNTAISEFRALYSQYGLPKFFAVDNIIDHKYFDNVLKDLSEQRPPFLVHYEIKSNLRRSQVLALAAAGVCKVQPGIESLNSTLLKLMRKGVSAIQNVQTLKWLSEQGMQVSWYLLYGFPGETIEPYREMAELIPRLHHITPPLALAPVYLERFSPYHSRPEDFGIRIHGPALWYRYAFPQVDPQLRCRLAYRFDFDEPGRDPAINRYIADVIAPKIREWENHYRTHGCTLAMVHGPAETAIICGPFEKPERIVRIGGVMSRALRMTESIISQRRLLEGLGGHSTRSRALPVFQGNVSDDALVLDELNASDYSKFLHSAEHYVIDHTSQLFSDPSTALRQLERAGLVMIEEDRVLALPVNWTNRVKGDIEQHHKLEPAPSQSRTTEVGMERVA